MNEIINEINFKSDGSTGLTIFGEPVHVSKKELVERYLNLSEDEFFLSEAYSSVGNYVLIDNNSRRDNKLLIYTSMGYSGGYSQVVNGQLYFSTSLDYLLRNKTNVKINSILLHRYVMSHIETIYPFDFFISGVDRVPPARILKYDVNNFNLLKDSLLFEFYQERDCSFDVALEKTMNCFVEGNDKANFSVLFSGGVDSLSIFSALKVAGVDPSLITNDFGYQHSNSPRKALLVAKKLGKQVNVLEMSEPYNDDSVISTIMRCMELDFFVSPYNGVNKIANLSSDDLIFSGQNSDLILSHGMHHTQLPLLRHFIYTFDLAGIFKNLLRNFLLTSFVLNSGLIRKMFSYVIYLYHKKDMVSYYFNNTLDGYMQGLISSGMPFLIKLQDHESKQFYNSYNKVKNSVSERTPEFLIDCLKFYFSAANANKQGLTFSSPSKARVVYPLSSGTFFSFFGKKRTFKDMFRPKYKSFQYNEKVSGINYSNLMSKDEYVKSIKAGKDEVFDDQINDKKAVNKFIEMNVESFNIKESAFLIYLDESQSKNEIISFMNLIYSKLHSVPSRVEKKYFQECVRIINIDILIRTNVN